MKKFVSLSLVLMLLLSLPVFSFAAGTEYNYSEVEDHLSERLGGDTKWWKIDQVDALICLPTSFLFAPLSDEDRANDCILFALPDDDSGRYFLAYYSDAAGITLETLSSYNQNGFTGEMVTVNGIPAVLQRNTQDNILILSYLTQQNKLFQLLFTPLSDEDPFYSSIISTIQADIPVVAASDDVVPVNPVSGLISK